jgi:hypothetical protein
MNPWIAFGAIVAPLIVLGAAMCVGGLFGSSIAIEKQSRWINGDLAKTVIFFYIGQINVSN